MQADRCAWGSDPGHGQVVLPGNPVLQRTAQIRYIVIDVVDFSRNRSIEAQTEIMNRLARVVRVALQCCVEDREQVLCLPTGDGVCIGLIDQLDPFDPDIRIALMVLEQLHVLNLAERDPECRFGVRVGLNENQDNLVRDVAGGRNVVGLGINMAQRVMSLAGPFQLFLGASVHERLSQRRQYRAHLQPVQAIVKHGQRLLCYAYHDAALACFAAAATAGRPQQRSVAAPAPVLDLPLQRRPTKRWRAAAEPSFRLQVR